MVKYECWTSQPQLVHDETEFVLLVKRLSGLAVSSMIRCFTPQPSILQYSFESYPSGVDTKKPVFRDASTTRIIVVGGLLHLLIQNALHCSVLMSQNQSALSHRGCCSISILAYIVPPRNDSTWEKPRFKLQFRNDFTHMANLTRRPAWTPWQHFPLQCEATRDNHGGWK